MIDRNATANYLVKHEEAVEDLGAVVCYENFAELEGLPVGHQSRSQDQDNVQVGHHHHYGGHRTLHQRPVWRPRICQTQMSTVRTPKGGITHRLSCPGWCGICRRPYAQALPSPEIWRMSAERQGEQLQQNFIQRHQNNPTEWASRSWTQAEGVSSRNLNISGAIRENCCRNFGLQELSEWFERAVRQAALFTKRFAGSGQSYCQRPTRPGNYTN